MTIIVRENDQHRFNVPGIIKSRLSKHWMDDMLEETHTDQLCVYLSAEILCRPRINGTKEGKCNKQNLLPEGSPTIVSLPSIHYYFYFIFI